MHCKSHNASENIRVIFRRLALAMKSRDKVVLTCQDCQNHVRIRDPMSEPLIKSKIVLCCACCAVMLFSDTCRNITVW